MGGPAFEISPAETTAPKAVTLTMPPSGYTARAIVTDPCGRAIPGARVTVHGLTATPHSLPHGTAYVDWVVTSTRPVKGSGARISLVLASKQVIGGKATGCKTGHSPYLGRVHHAAAQPHTAIPAASQVPLVAGALAAAVLVTAVVAYLLGRRRSQAR